MCRIVRYCNGGSFAVWHITGVFRLVCDNGVKVVFDIMAVESGVRFGVGKSLFSVINNAVVCVCFSMIVVW